MRGLRQSLLRDRPLIADSPYSWIVDFWIRAHRNGKMAWEPVRFQVKMDKVVEIYW